MAKVIGDKELMRELKRQQRKHRGAVMAALFQEGASIFADSQEEVPVDTGRLRASGLVYPDRASSTVFISYGTAYALKIHEATELDAKRKERSELASSNPGAKVQGAQTGKSKYLQDPFERASSGMLQRLAARTKKNVDRGIGEESTKTIKGNSKG